MVEAIEMSPILASILAGLLYGLVFASKAVLQDNEEEFDVFRLGPTLALSGLIGASFEIFNVSLTLHNFTEIMGMFIGVIALSEATLKALVRGDRKTARKSGAELAEEAIDTVLGISATNEPEAARKAAEEIGVSEEIGKAVDDEMEEYADEEYEFDIDEEEQITPDEFAPETDYEIEGEEDDTVRG